VALTLLAVAWPLLSFVYLDSQLTLADEIINPAFEIYLPTIVVQLLILGLVLLAVRSEGDRPGAIGLSNFNRWTLLAGAGFLLVANFVLYLLHVALFAGSPASFAEISPLLPKSAQERVVWAFLCGVVAFSEEITFRGYLISRIGRLTGGRVWIGVLISSLAFASGHLYQGFGGFALIFVYGLMFAGLYLSTRSLFPGIIAHFLQDFAAMFLPS
jgi:membrane protease YdiL (CAAX protease family)